MIREVLLWAAVGLYGPSGAGTQIEITGMAPPDRVVAGVYESRGLLPMNEMDMESGYALYQARITVAARGPVLRLENVRDYAAVYVDGRLCGSVTDGRKSLRLDVEPGEYTLQLYAENIGRMTYGPEILDNNKGLFGRVTLDGAEINGWTISPLRIKEAEVARLDFGELTRAQCPGFYRGHFDAPAAGDVYLDTSGWGMGEVWINGRYTGSFWEEEKQRSISIPAEFLFEGRNEIVIFELKNNGTARLRFSTKPVFE